ncbi:MAG: zinc ribbon domain-containing protein [Pseudomonadota bacterium]
MPIYAYRCEACGFAKDVLQKVSDPQLTVCLSCDAPSFKKQLTAAGFQLKGTGWYATDFRNGNNKPVTAKEDGDADKAAGSKTDDGKAGSEKAGSDKTNNSAGGNNGTDKAGTDKPADSKPTSAGSSTGTSAAGTISGTTSGNTAGTSSATPSSKV